MLLSSLIISLSCAKTKSENIKTSGFFADIKVTGSNEGSTYYCSVYFQVESGGTYIELNSGDAVTCNGNTMSKSVLGSIVSYSTNISAAAGNSVTVTLTRSGENPYESTVVIPSLINSATLTGTPVNSVYQFTKGSTINLSWTPTSVTSEYMKIYLEYNYQESKGKTYEINDTAPEDGVGSFSSTQTNVAGEPTGSWDGNISFYRFNEGTIATGLKGTIKSYQKKSFTITLVD